MSINFFDAYNLRARTSVVLFYALPFIFDALAFLGKGITAVEGIALTVLILVAVQCTLHLCRPNHQPFNKNYAAEMLLSDSAIPDITLKRYYRKISSFEPEFSEFRNVETTDTKGIITTDLCESVVTWLRAKTRDTKVFRLVYEENINYGFIRNMYNLKKYGIIFNCIALMFFGVIIFTPFLENSKPSLLVMVLETAAHSMATIYLIAAITQTRVEVSAKRYAKALIETIDLIEE